MDNEEIKKLLQELKETSSESSAVRSKVVKIHMDTPAEAERRQREKARAKAREARRQAEEKARAEALEEELRLEAEKAALEAVEEAKAAVAAFPGVRLIEDYEGRCYPTPLDTTDQDLVWVGRIRRDLIDDDGITLWCCGDQIRKGAAANAVQILRFLAVNR